MVIPESLLPLSVNPLAEREALLATSLGIDSAPPKFRYQQFNHLLEGAGCSDVGDVKSVQVCFANPL